ncbi:matrix metalloproteinase 17 [Trichuris trichiura]|uniref:Matrix metalloproteinase 17 n=1 Tax=Trichuris trichiura TaxID=36087 RepID=A0A077ZKV2_TRITR|nr:matrix metalloproteinase 17 [Trichuris trichiura]
MVEFGYLPRSNPEISNLRTDVAVKKALSRLQEFAGLEATGELNDATLKLMSTKRCGLPDIPYARKRRSPWQGSTWPQKNLTYKLRNYGLEYLFDQPGPRIRIIERDFFHMLGTYNAHNEAVRKHVWSSYAFRVLPSRIVSFTNHLGLGRTRRAVFDALSVWSEASDLTFTETQDDQADILIEFLSGDHGDGYPFDGPNVILAHAFFPGAGRGGDIHFDNDEIWTEGPFDAQSGKLNGNLGLGHSKVRNALMFPYYSGFDRRVELDYDDIIAIQKLYGVGPRGTPAATDVSIATLAPAFDNETDDDLASTTDEPNAVPDPCHTEIDALSRIRNEIFAFKKQYFWRLDQQGHLVEKPLDIERFWYGFNINITHIDAVYERPDLDRTVFFIGRQFWEFTANVALPGYPKNLTEIGLPDSVEKIDAAFVWDYNGKTYFFSGDQYWRFDETSNFIEHDYPRNIKIWSGVPPDVDSAFTDNSGKRRLHVNGIKAC